MDGTIVDTEPYWIECEYELVAEFVGSGTRRRRIRWSATTCVSAAIIRTVAESIFHRRHRQPSARRRHRACATQQVPWRPGHAKPAELRKAGIPCVGDDELACFADAVVKALPPGRSTVITGDRGYPRQAASEPHLKAASRLGVQHCVAIEDSHGPQRHCRMPNLRCPTWSTSPTRR
jgi:beta-phosphoglucomutase-like phosphatase (HAD superfamily)